MGINCNGRAAALLTIKLTTRSIHFFLRQVLGKFLDNEVHTEFIAYGYNVGVLRKSA